jgi:hypothetical protein
LCDPEGRSTEGLVLSLATEHHGLWAGSHSDLSASCFRIPTSQDQESFASSHSTFEGKSSYFSLCQENPLGYIFMSFNLVPESNLWYFIKISTTVI